MIKLLKRFVEWLETRFPPKVVITQDSLDEIKIRLDYEIVSINKCLHTIGLHESRLDDLSKSISALKEGIVKGEIRPALTERERERQEFINGAIPRNMPSRRELEAAERK